MTKKKAINIAEEWYGYWNKKLDKIPQCRSDPNSTFSLQDKMDFCTNLRSFKNSYRWIIQELETKQRVKS